MWIKFSFFQRMTHVECWDRQVGGHVLEANSSPTNGSLEHRYPTYTKSSDTWSNRVADQDGSIAYLGQNSWSIFFFLILEQNNFSLPLSMFFMMTKWMAISTTPYKLPFWRKIHIKPRFDLWMNSHHSFESYIGIPNFCSKSCILWQYKKLQPLRKYSLKEFSLDRK